MFGSKHAKARGMKFASYAALTLVVTSSLAACEKKQETPPNPKEMAAPVAASAAPVAETADIDPTTLLAFRALPAVMEGKDNAITEEKVNLGRALYYDTRLSAGQDVSCNTCHLLDRRSASTASQVSTGHKRQTGERNSPTVYNAAGPLRRSSGTGARRTSRSRRRARS